MRPSKILWLFAIVLFAFFFASWNFSDTTVIIGHEIDFADSIVHGEFKSFYQRAYDRWDKYVQNDKAGHRVEAPVYDLPANLVLGIWGLPLYFLGRTDYDTNFWVILYGKGLFFLAFIASAFLVYKICCALELDEDKSQWGAFIYFTSSMAWNSVCFVGNIDALCVLLTLAGVLAYIRERNIECFIWFLLAVSMKQLAIFIYIPLLLLKDKNILRVPLKMILLMLLNSLLSLPILNTPGAASAKTNFLLNMIRRLFENTIPFLSSGISIMVLLYGMLCIYCWLHTEPKDSLEHRTMTLWVAMTSIAITLSSIICHPNWFLYLAPYIAISVVYCGKKAEEILLFETIGSLCILSYNFLAFGWVYLPDCAHNMLLDKLIGRPHADIPSYIYNIFIEPSDKSQLYEKLFSIARNVIQASSGAVYVACMLAIIFWLCKKDNACYERPLNMTMYASIRLFVNASACCIPLLAFLKTIL